MLSGGLYSTTDVVSVGTNSQTTYFGCFRHRSLSVAQRVGLSGWEQRTAKRSQYCGLMYGYSGMVLTWEDG